MDGSLRFKQRALALAQPLAAHLELTYRCNWRCVFCYNPRHFDKKRMSAAEWSVVLDDLRELGTLTLMLTGGEPMTHPEFFEIARQARRRAFALRIFTNGTLIDEEAADAVAALRPMGVEMSIHGADAEVHDRTTATPGSFDRMLHGLDLLKARGVPLHLKTPLTKWNEHQIDGIIALGARLGVPLAIDPTLTQRDDGDHSPLGYSASPAAIRRLMEMPEIAAANSPVERRKGSANCGLGRITLAVDPEGNVFPCLQWRQTSLGNVRQTRLRDLWHGSPERLAAADVAVAANDRLLEMGPALSSFPFCPALAYQQTGDPTLPDERTAARAEFAAEIRAASAADAA